MLRDMFDAADADKGAAAAIDAMMLRCARQMLLIFQDVTP